MLTDFRQHAYFGEANCVFCGVNLQEQSENTCLSRKEIGRRMKSLIGGKKEERIGNKREAESGVVVGG